MATITKAQKLAEYRALYPEYHITGVSKITPEQIEARKKCGYGSLYELYARPSQAKVDSYNELLRQYNPRKVISVQGNSMTYSVLLEAENGVLMHITRNNNYILELVEE